MRGHSRAAGQGPGMGYQGTAWERRRREAFLVGFGGGVFVTAILGALVWLLF